VCVCARACVCACVCVCMHMPMHLHVCPRARMCKCRQTPVYREESHCAPAPVCASACTHWCTEKGCIEITAPVLTCASNCAQEDARPTGTGAEAALLRERLSTEMLSDETKDLQTAGADGTQREAQERGGSQAEAQAKSTVVTVPDSVPDASDVNTLKAGEQSPRQQDAAQPGAQIMMITVITNYCADNNNNDMLLSSIIPDEPRWIVFNKMALIAC
jgi:hypothetical protein